MINLLAFMRNVLALSHMCFFFNSYIFVFSIVVSKMVGQVNYFAAGLRHVIA